ncbi:MAG: succinylglutamic semialdehyde dehydrogenase, partial [Pseudobdellovibrio sp.]|nr:succinylglutamic semialdehyde dehydrogenase [Pseudobdellovibrio sp.]
MSVRPVSFAGDFINGKFITTSKSDGQIKDVSPADLTDQIMTVTYQLDHVDMACKAAKAAYLPWAKLSLNERKNYILRLRELFVAHEAEIAETIARDTGKALWDATTEAKALVGKIDITLNESLKLVQEEHIQNALPQVEGVIRYRSRGVMAVVGPFNFPAHLPNGHIIPALVTGNTIVYKPSEQTPAVAQLYTQLIEKAGFPEGVFNLVYGEAETGRRLISHELVDGVLFTGSYEVGLKIKQETLTHYWKI